MKKILILMWFVLPMFAYSQTQIEESIEKYDKLLNDKKYTEIIKELTEKKDELTYLEDYYLGLSYFRLENDGLAQQAFNKSIQKNSGFFKAHDYLAASLYYSGNYYLAIDEYKICLKIYNKYDRGNYMIGQSYEKLDKLDLALEYYINAVSQKPEEENYNYKVGYTYFTLKKYSESKTYLETVILQNQNNYSATSMLLQVYYHIEDFSKTDKLAMQLRLIKQNTKDTRIKDFTYFQIDEFMFNEYKIIAKEKFDLSGDLYYYWLMLIYDKNNVLVKSFNLESSTVTRELGMPYIIGIDEYNSDKRIHKTTNIGFNEIPKYEVFKDLTKKEIEIGLNVSASGSYKK